MRWIIGILAVLLPVGMSYADHYGNRPAVRTISVTVSVANIAQQLPSQFIPDGTEAVFRAASTNTGTVRIQESATASGFALGAGEAISLAIANTNVLFIESTVAGDVVEIITESAK